jgi:hypothetical protein
LFINNRIRPLTASRRVGVAGVPAQRQQSLPSQLQPLSSMKEPRLFSELLVRV